MHIRQVKLRPELKIQMTGKVLRKLLLELSTIYIQWCFVVRFRLASEKQFPVTLFLVALHRNMMDVSRSAEFC